MTPAESETRTIEISKETEDQARALMHILKQELGTFESFVARRFDELSVEINATSQQMGMVEEGLAGRFGDIIGVLSSISHHGDGLSAANTGVELDTVIKTTEEAANTIIDAAEKIAGNLQKDIDWADENARLEVLDEINNKLQDILLACTFQDLAGQRITKAIENLRNVETQLDSTLKGLGIEIAEQAAVQDSGDNEQKKPASQDDIDALFG
jgi:chemotaxis protein CheZ